MDEHSLSISGGFGTIKLGNDDSVGDNFGIEAEDLIAEEQPLTCKRYCFNRYRYYFR